MYKESGDATTRTRDEANDSTLLNRSQERGASNALFNDAYLNNNYAQKKESLSQEQRSAVTDTTEPKAPSIKDHIIADVLCPVFRPGELKKIFDKVDGMDDQGYLWNGKDDTLTKDGIDKFLANAQVPEKADAKTLRYLSQLKELSDHWNDKELDAFKTEDGAISSDSFFQAYLDIGIKEG